MDARRATRAEAIRSGDLILTRRNLNCSTDY